MLFVIKMIPAVFVEEDYPSLICVDLRLIQYISSHVTYSETDRWTLLKKQYFYASIRQFKKDVVGSKALRTSLVGLAPGFVDIPRHCYKFVVVSISRDP